jgi:MFS family permease
MKVAVKGSTDEAALRIEAATSARGGRVATNEDDSAPSPRTQSKHAFQAVVLAAGVSSLTAATLGYDVGIVAAAINYINKSMELDHSQTQLVVGSLNFVSAFGTLIAGQASDALGRKKTVCICCALYVVSLLHTNLALLHGFASFFFTN